MVYRFRFLTLLALVMGLFALGFVSSGSGADAAGPPGHSELDRAIAAQEAHTDRLMAIPGVVGTAVGLNPGGHPVVKIYTETATVPGLPGSLDNVPAVIEVTGRIFALAPPPTDANFTYTCSGLTCDFDASTSTGRGKFSYDWDFGDATPNGSGITVSHTYAEPVTYPVTYEVTLTATAAKSGPDSVTQTVTFSEGGGGNSPPTASFSYSCAEVTCVFTDASSDSDGTVVEWGWEFGDGNTSTAQNPTHTYTGIGTYTVALTVTDNEAATGSTSQSVAVSDDCASTTERCLRPVPIGVSTGHPDITAGTIGARVTDGTAVFALSNNHVYANQNKASIGDSVMQPGTFDGGASPADDIGVLSDFELIQFNGPDNTMDAAISLSSTANLGNATPSDGYGTPGSAPVSATLNLPVQKYGRTTSLTTGAVSEINVIVDVCYESIFNVCTKWARFVDQLAVGGGSFSAGGDSGSLIVTNDANKEPVGLLFAGSATRTIGNRIDLVLNRFDVTIDGVGSSGPSVTITSPADGSVVGGSAVAVAADATDDDGVTQVEFFVDGASIGVDTTAPFAVSWDTTPATEDADHTVMATATNTADHTASDIVTVTVDNTDNPPSVQITSPANGATVGGTMTTTADAYDDRGVSQVEFFVGSTSIGVDSDGSNGWSVAWDTTTATDGGYTVTASATDSASQTASDSVSVTVNNSEPTTVSVASITYATTGPHLFMTVALVDDLGNQVSGALVDIWLTNTTTGQLWIGSDGSTGDDGKVTWRLRNAPSGTYTTIFVAVNAAGLTWDGIIPPNSFFKQ